MKEIFCLSVLIVCLILIPAPVHAAGVNGDAQISGMFDGSPIVIKTTNQLAGAVDSLTWKGVEFVDSGHDHGRQIQYAWNLNGRGECNNPTEAGSRDDANKPTSTSVLLSLTSTSNSLTTTVRPAYWLAPGETSGWCSPANSSAQNTTTVSNYILKKTITIGAGGLPNVIEFLSDITVPETVSDMHLYSPVDFHLTFLSTFWTYDPRSKNLTDVTSSLSSSASGVRYLKSAVLPILATPDKSLAVGVYASNLPNENVGGRHFELISFDSSFGWPTNVINSVYNLGANVPGTYHYRTEVVLGSLTQVTSTLDSLYSLSPAILESPTDGFTGAATCQHINGWSGWPDDVTRQTSVNLYADSVSETGKFLGSALTTTNWGPGTCKSLGGTNCDICSTTNAPQCLHGFDFAPPTSLKDGKSHQIYIYGVSPGGMFHQLNASPVSISCPTEASVIGALDVANCSSILGWSGDKDNPNASNDVDIYANGPNNAQGGTFVGATTANTIREKAVCDVLGSTQSPCPHGFVFNTPNSLKDGQSHTIYTYGINLPNTPGTNVLLSGSPKTITCNNSFDINGDGKIDILDLARIVNLRTSLSVAVPANTPEDLDSDLDVDETDLRAFLAIYTHL